MDIQIRREARWAVARHGVAAAIGWIAREHPEVPYNLVRNVVRGAARLAARRADRDYRQIRPVNPREIAPADTSDETMEYIGGDGGDGGGFYSGQFRTGRHKFGRYKSASYSLNKLDRRDAAYAIERYGAMNGLHDANGGFYKMIYHNNNNIGQLPFYAFDLTTRRLGPNGTTVCPFVHGLMDGVGNNLYFEQVQGHANNGNDLTNIWEPVKTNVDPGLNKGATGALQYSHVRILARAPTNVPGIFKIQLVQVKEGMFAPHMLTAANSSRTALYEQYLSGSIYNPLSRSVGSTMNSRQNLTVLRTWIHKSSPDSTQNKDSNGGQYLFDIFLNLNRYCQFRRQAGIAYADDAYLADDYIQNQTDEVVNNYVVNPRSRLYLLISATTTGDTAFNAAFHFSFDMEIRNKWVFNPIS